MLCFSLPAVPLYHCHCATVPLCPLQSPWYIEGGPTVVRTSIQEELERRLQPLLQAEATSFTASGRCRCWPTALSLLLMHTPSERMLL